jgi:hypothetical protein
MPTPWLTPLEDVLASVAQVGLDVRWQQDWSLTHRDVADALIEAFTADAPDIAAQIGDRAFEELVVAHHLWSEWLRDGRVRKIAVVAEKRASRITRR